MVVVTVKELLRLIAVQRDIGRIKVQYDAPGRLAMTGNELLPEQPVRLDDRTSVHGGFEPVQRGSAGQRIESANGCLQGKIGPQRLMVVEILIAGGDGEQALLQQCFQAVPDLAGLAIVRQPPGQGRGQPGSAIHFSQQQQAGITGDMATGEMGFDTTAEQG